jgi:hypothetical protein
VFDNLAARGKTSVDWFFGFKLHLVVNEEGELLNVHLTPRCLTRTGVKYRTKIVRNEENPDDWAKKG